MVVTLNSRYLDHKVERVSEESQTRNVLVPPAVRTRTFNFTNYQWMEADRIDSLARDFFDDETLWYVIADANPEILLWDEVPTGTVIRIPNA